MELKKLLAAKNFEVSRLYSGFLLILAGVYSSSILAASGSGSGSGSGTQPDASTLLNNVSSQIPQLMQLVTAGAYVLGMYMVVMAVMKLKEYGEQRTQMSKEHSMRTPIIMFSVGAILLYLPTSVQTGMNTFWQQPNPYVYVNPGASDPWSTLIQDTYLIVQFIGTIAFIKGILMMNQLSGQGQPGTFSRAMSHVVGGLMCINLSAFVSMIMATLGLAQS